MLARGAHVEWSSEHLLGIDAADGETAQVVVVHRHTHSRTWAQRANQLAGPSRRARALDLLKVSAPDEMERPTRTASGRRARRTARSAPSPRTPRPRRRR